jgi:hypothetical protein
MDGPTSLATRPDEGRDTELGEAPLLRIVAAKPDRRLMPRTRAGGTGVIALMANQ